MVGVMTIMATSFKGTYALTVVFSAPDPTTGHCQPTPLPKAPEHSQASPAQFLVGSLLLSPESWYAQDFVYALQESLFPQSFGSSVIKSHWPSKSNSLWVLSCFARSPSWEICCGPRTFSTVQELLWYNCSLFCGSSAWWLYGGT